VDIPVSNTAAWTIRPCHDLWVRVLRAPPV